MEDFRETRDDKGSKNIDSSDTIIHLSHITNTKRRAISLTMYHNKKVNFVLGMKLQATTDIDKVFIKKK